jgi:Flp pilus assembly protein TadD
LASAYFQLNRIQEGVAELRKSLQVEPDNPTALSTLAFVAIKTGDQAGARECLRQVRQQPRILPENRAALEKAFRDQFGQPPD